MQSIECLLQLPQGVLVQIISSLQSLNDTANCQLVSTELLEAVNAALASKTSYWSSDHRELSHLKATRLFKFLGRHCPHLIAISCCYAADRLYGGTLLDASLGSLFAGVPYLAHLTLLNVDVTDAVLQQLARHCPLLQHMAIGRTENNAFGNFVSDAGLAVLASACRQLDSLCLFRCYSCSDVGLAELTQQGRQLTRLVLHSCPQVTAAGLIKFIEATPVLQELDVLMPEAGPGGAAVTFDTCFALAAQCPGLKVLRLSEEQLSGGVLDDSCVSVLARGCTQLQELELVQVEVTDEAMSALASYCTQLTSLRLEQTYVGDEGAQKLLAACPHLKELRMAGCSTHSWMLPAEYMFAGLSVSGIGKMAAAKGAGAELSSLDLSCVAYEQQQEPSILLPQLLLLPGTSVGEGPTAAAAAVPGGTMLTSAAAFNQHSSSTAASMSISPGSSSPGGSSSSSSSSPGSDLSSVLAALSIGGSSSSSSNSNSSRSLSSWITRKADGTDKHADDTHAPSSDQDPGYSPSLVAPLIPSDWCARLTSLSLDWLKVDGAMLQGPLLATLRSCSSLDKLSLVGYQGDVDAMLPAVARAGAAIKHLNLQHSQVTDAGLAAAVQHLPKLQMLYLSYCRHIGDNGLEHVIKLGQLQELDLYNTPCVSTVAVARLARYTRSLRRLYIGHNTSALARSPAQTTAMGYISSSERTKYGSATSSVWAAVSEAAASRIGSQLSVLCRNPSSESEFEKRTLHKLLHRGAAAWVIADGSGPGAL